MDNKITRSRLKILFSYDLIKLIVFVVIGCVLWSLLFTIFGDSLSEGQSLNVYWYNVTVYEDEIEGLLGMEGEDDFKSYEIHDTTTYNFGEYSASNTTVPQQFSAWVSVGQLDVMFISNAKDMDSVTTDSSGQTTTVKTALSENYSAYYYGLKSLTDKAKGYCKRMGNYTDAGKPDSDDAVKAYFHTRQRKSNFYRHGLITEDMEVERFEKIWAAACKMEGWLNDDSLDIWATKTVDGVEVICGIDMGKLDKLGSNPVTGKRASSLCGYKAAGKEDGVAAAEGVMLAVFDNESFQADQIYESLAFVVAVIENYSALGANA
jgi:hypothetical protein